MKILFYIEPWLIKKDAKHFTPWLFSIFSVIKQDQHDICICCGDHQLGADQIRSLTTKYQTKISIIYQNELEEIFSDYKESQRRDYSDIYEEDQLAKKINLLKVKLEDFTPNLIIYSGGAGAPFLKKLFPKVPILFKCNSMIQAPILYPRGYFLDVCGIHNNSFLNIFHEEIKRFKCDNKISSSFLSKIRESYCDKIRSHNPITRRDLDPEGNFKYIVFLPLESAKIFNFFNHADFVTQFDLIKYILDRIDQNTALVVTKHISPIKHNALSDEEINYLRERHKNFIYLGRLGKSLISSHFILDLSDAVITVSSTMGMQSLLWKKPFFVIGDMYIKHYSDGSKIEDIRSVLEKDYQDKDNALFYMLTHYYLLNVYWEDSKWFNGFINRFVKLHGNIDSNFYKPIDNPEKILSHYLKHTQSFKFRCFLKLERFSYKYRILGNISPVARSAYMAIKRAKLRLSLV